MHLRASKLIEELSVIFPPPWVNHFSTPAPYSILPKLMSPWLESRPSSPSILILLYRLKRPWTTNFIQASTPSFFSFLAVEHRPTAPPSVYLFFSIFMLLSSSLWLSLLCVCLPCASQEHRFIIVCFCLLYGLLLLRSQSPSSASFTFFSSCCGRGVWLLFCLPNCCSCYCLHHAMPSTCSSRLGVAPSSPSVHCSCCCCSFPCSVSARHCCVSSSRHEPVDRLL